MTLKGPKEAGASKGSQAEGFFSGETPYGPGQRWTERSLPGLCAGGQQLFQGSGTSGRLPKPNIPPPRMQGGKMSRGKGGDNDSERSKGGRSQQRFSG